MNLLIYNYSNSKLQFLINLIYTTQIFYFIIHVITALYILMALNFQ